MLGTCVAFTDIEVVFPLLKAEPAQQLVFHRKSTHAYAHVFVIVMPGSAICRIFGL